MFNYILIGRYHSNESNRRFFRLSSDTLTSTINAKVGYIKFERIDSVQAALNLTNTILIDRPLIVTQVFDNNIPDETDAMIYCAPLNPNIT
jgi:hypothetical protein